MSPLHLENFIGGGCLAGGEHGFYVEPTVVVGLEQRDEMIQNEVFGPVNTVQIFQNEEEPLAKANDVPYALACSVWTRDFGRAMRMPGRLESNARSPQHGGF